MDYHSKFDIKKMIGWNELEKEFENMKKNKKEKMIKAAKKK